MSKRDSSISSTRPSSHEASCAALRTNPETQAEREDGGEIPVNELRVAVHKTSGNRYGSTKISNNASAVLGDVTHHNYFYGGKVPYLAGLQVYQEGDTVDPDTISDYDFSYARWLRSEQRLEHTCEWIFERREYKRWITKPGPPILVVSGTVGTGKSITASAVIDRLASRHEKAQLVISYFVDHSRDQPTTCIEILRALVKQILQVQRSSNEDIAKDFQSSVNTVFPSTQARPSAKAITSLLSKCMLKIKSCIFVLDGIDALPEREIDEFLDFLHELFPLTKNQEFSHKLIVFCRHSLGRGVRLESIPSSALCEIRLEDIQRDLFAFVEHEVDSRQHRRSITDDLQLIAETKSVLKTHCGKMFLWIRLQILSLWDPGLINCDDDVRQQLSSLPKDLDETYTRCLRRIERTYSKNSREIALKLFKWVACAYEPLTQLQAREAVSITPETIPLQKSQILNTPAEDHCANLVTLDEVSGRVVFPHPSVKDFLRDPLKVPPDLHHYLLSVETDELSCGEVCLAYADYLRTRKQIIPYKTARVQNNIPTLLIKDVPGAWLSSLFRKPRPEQAFHMPLPAPARKADDLRESHLHDYMRRHWLSHNRQIKSTAPNYAAFVTLCMGHDLQLQPWTAERMTELEHCQKLFELAIMTNHIPLFEVVVDHFGAGKNELVSRVLRKNCPGTDSSWLHVCATLGHQEVTQLVLRHCPKTTIAHGKSAAILALEHKNFNLFGSLIPNPLPGPVWTLFSSGQPKTSQENLLRACAMYGDETVIDTIFDRLQQRLPREYLSDALLHACKYNSLESFQKIVSAGASTESFHLMKQDEEYYKFQFSLTSLNISALVMAWHLGDLKLWKNLRFTKPKKVYDSPNLTDDCLRRLLRITGGSKAMDGASVFQSLEILSRQLTTKLVLDWVKGVPTWLEIIILCTQDLTRRNLANAWNGISRKLLTALDTSYMSRQVPTGEIVRRGTSHLKEGHPMLRWLDWVADDVLVRVLKSDLVREQHLLNPTMIERLAQRWTSRGLEAWLESLRIERTLCYKQSNDTSQRECLSATLAKLTTKYTPSDWYPMRTDYFELLAILKLEAQQKGRVQIMDFLACYEFAGKPGDNATGRDQIRNDRSLRSMDGNFALNYPAGYASSGYDPTDYYLSVGDVTGQRVQGCIVEAVYRWNFRLRRKQRASFSDAEMWYMAYLVKRITRRDWVCGMAK